MLTLVTFHAIKSPCAGIHESKKGSIMGACYVKRCIFRHKCDADPEETAVRHQTEKIVLRDPAVLPEDSIMRLR